MAQDALMSQTALQKASWTMFSSSLWPRRHRGSKMHSRSPLEHIFELFAAQETQRPQNALQKVSWSIFSRSLRPRRLRGPKMLSPKCSSEAPLEVFNVQQTVYDVYTGLQGGMQGCRRFMMTPYVAPGWVCKGGHL